MLVSKLRTLAKPITTIICNSLYWEWGILSGGEGSLSIGQYLGLYWDNGKMETTVVYRDYIGESHQDQGPATVGTWKKLLAGETI